MLQRSQLFFQDLDGGIVDARVAVPMLLMLAGEQCVLEQRRHDGPQVTVIIIAQMRADICRAAWFFHCNRLLLPRIATGEFIFLFILALVDLIHIAHVRQHDLCFLHQLPGQLRRKEGTRPHAHRPPLWGRMPPAPHPSNEAARKYCLFLQRASSLSLLMRASPSMGHSVLYAGCSSGMV